MTTVTYYYAFDDTEFYSEEECREYEEKWLNALREFKECYDFFDENMNILICESDELEDLEEWIDKGYSGDYLRIKKMPSAEAVQKVNHYYGYFFPDEVGFYITEDGAWKRAE